ncbi:S8 family peptidase [Desertivirga xinjiangensis]|uniref:S8 family peptidase n=1 Tax=Desertivirga xinjiangensis TaxID=539206 RepID=UPI00210E7701|nr:S8 family peptidase [Pedobacter xinjiangensis]
MKRLLLPYFIAFSALSSFAQEKKKGFTFPAAHTSPDYVPGKVVFKLKESPQKSNKRTFSENVVYLQSVTVMKIEKKFHEAATGEKERNKVFNRAENFGLDRIYELTIPDSEDISSAIDELLQSEEVEYAEPLYIYQASYIPADPALINQSYLEKVKAPQAWDLIRNIRKTIIAIVDSGSDLEHPDLAGNISYNVNDPVNGVDDDGDGYIDNYRGWDFVGATASNMAEDNDPNITQQGGDHGVHVSGIASAVTDNSTGVASIAFNTAQLLIIKAAADDNGTKILRGYEGIKYAADHGAKIINCSWGGVGASFYGQDVVNYAIEKGCLIVAAAGNSSDDIPQYPAGFDGVLAVANVGVDDVRNSTSNYGYYVSLAAPGANIYSTTFDNTYGSKTGTSMASPVVASAAALLSAYLPHFSMQQIGAQLRATADNIDAFNPGFGKRLGSGRLNVYRALTESPPSIKIQNITLSDKANGIIPAADTLTITIDLKNFLSPVNNLQVNLLSDDPNVVITEGLHTVASIGTLMTQNNVGPFKIFIKPGTPDNSQVEFRLQYSANGTYQDFEGFVVTVARDYLNISNDIIATTLTSTGQIGFLEAGTDAGTLGFQYKGNQLLYEAALMIGNSESKVSNNARSSAEESDNHFVKRVKIQSSNTADAISARAEFDDKGSPSPLNVYVKQRSWIYKDVDTGDVLIAEYEVHNPGNTELRNVFVGLFMDWDIDGGSTNATAYDPATKTARVFDKSGGSQPLAGVKLLSEASPCYYPLSNSLSNDILANNDFTIEEKFKTLSNGIRSQSLGLNVANGLDVSFVTGYGPYIIPANGSVKVAFALIGAENEDELEAAGGKAQKKYSVIYEASKVAAVTIKAYPNPLTGGSASQRLSFTLPETKRISLDLYNTMGQKVKTFIKSSIYQQGEYTSVCDLSDVGSGVYIYRLNVDGDIKSFKIVKLE